MNNSVFDQVTHRRGTGCVKWDEAPNDKTLPLWVADMDFEVAPAIRQAVVERAVHGIYGYTLVEEGYYNAVIQWFKRRHGWMIERQSMLYTSGVVPALSCIIRAATMPGERVLILTPVYNCFFSSIRNNGCEPSESALVVGCDGRYSVDWQDFEQRCADSKTTLFLLCNPHNPGGRVWTKEELQHMGEICRRYGVLVVSDEIHNELVMPGYHYTPFAVATAGHEGQCVVCTAASKAFNIAGLQMANIVCTDAALRRRIDRAININEVCDVNPFGPIATIAAYNESEEWLDALLPYISDNYKLLCSRIASSQVLSCLIPMPLEGTYLAWVNATALCQRLGTNAEGLEQWLMDHANVWFNAGTLYGAAGEGYLRINLACSRATLSEALDRVEAALAT